MIKTGFNFGKAFEMAFNGVLGGLISGLQKLAGMPFVS